MPKPYSVFIVHAREDVHYLDELLGYLAPMERAGMLKIWCDRDMNSFEKWDDPVLRRINTADIILLLVSQSYLKSAPSHSKELNFARMRHKSGDTTVIPVILEPCDFDNDPIVSTFSKLPQDSGTLKNSEQSQDLWPDVAGMVIQEVERRNNIRRTRKGNTPKLTNRDESGEQDTAGDTPEAPNVLEVGWKLSKRGKIMLIALSVFFVGILFFYSLLKQEVQDTMNISSDQEVVDSMIIKPKFNEEIFINDSIRFSEKNKADTGYFVYPDSIDFSEDYSNWSISKPESYRQYREVFTQYSYSRLPEGINLDIQSFSIVDGSLKSRNIIKKGEIKGNQQPRGRVVIDICVDAKGNVIEKNFQPNGSSTLDNMLISNALDAAGEYKFEMSTEDRSCGSVTFYFR